MNGFDARDSELAALIETRSGRDQAVCLFAYDLERLRQHVKAVVTSLPERCRMYYAVKANSAAPILHCLAPIVAGFEVASGGEIEKVRAVDEDALILFGGPAKTQAEIRLALKASVTRIHAESILELYRISEVAAEFGCEVEVLLRVNLAGPFPSSTLMMAGSTQFGIDESDLPAAIRAATSLPGVKFVGFHLHSLSNNLSADAHLAMLELYRDTVMGWERTFGVTVEVLDVGGGIGINYQNPAMPFDWLLFARLLADWVDTVPAHWGEIQFECGRYLTAECGHYVAEVLDVKRTHGVAWALIRGGTHHFRLPSSWQHSHPFSVISIERWELPLLRPTVRDQLITVAGELCSPKDVLARDVRVALLRAGDILVFQLAGAYGWEISHHEFLSHDHPERLFLTRDSARNGEVAARWIQEEKYFGH
ncbi:type III PLP-dependent enzyme [Rhodococcus sp. NPDC060176]|uniref:type III PLP-dependent enzyme n=1 Tax=Rhodococcus sp. NPDC060176 TaxID=3347062 RepID=UPI0036689BEE